MAKKKTLLPKAPTPWNKLQAERADLQARLAGTKGYMLLADRQAAVIRLTEVKRELNRLWATGV